MANILDYVEWRGDLPFQERAFNDVDNLIFSELAYVDLMGILDNGGSERTVTVTEAYRQYKEFGKDQSGLRCNPAPLLEKCAGTERFGSVIIRDYIDMRNQGAQFQFSAMTFMLDDGSLYVAFRGTDDSLAGWREDLNFTYMEATPAQLCAVEYLDMEIDRAREMCEGSLPPVRVGGHSKGGNLAIYSAAFCEDSVRDTIVMVYSNDGPGFNETIVEDAHYQSILDKVNLIIPESSLIGIMLFNKYDKQIVQSTARRGSQQHIPYSWMVTKSGFVQAEKQTSASLIMNRTLDEWVMRLSADQRKEFVDILFDTLESSGAGTFTQIYSDKMSYYNAIRKAITKLAPEQVNTLFGVLGQLFLAGRDVFRDEKRLAKKENDPEDEETDE